MATVPPRAARAREQPMDMRVSRRMWRQRQLMITLWTRFSCVSDSSADIRLLIMCYYVCPWCSTRSSPSHTCSLPAQWCTGELRGSRSFLSKSYRKPWLFRCNIPQCDSPDSPYDANWLNFTIPYKNSEWDMCHRYNSTPVDPSIDMCSADYFGSGIESCGNDFKFRDEEKTISTEVNTQICPSKSLLSYINIFKCLCDAYK